MTVLGSVAADTSRVLQVLRQSFDFFAGGVDFLAVSRQLSRGIPRICFVRECLCFILPAVFCLPKNFCTLVIALIVILQTLCAKIIIQLKTLSAQSKMQIQRLPVSLRAIVYALCVVRARRFRRVVACHSACSVVVCSSVTFYGGDFLREVSGRLCREQTVRSSPDLVISLTPVETYRFQGTCMGMTASVDLTGVNLEDDSR